MAILGIDEVGRGPWAGPLLVCACILHARIPDLTDSKKLTPKRREQLDPIIKANSSYGFGWVSAAELDTLGLSQSLREATRRAVRQIKSPFHQIIIDGTVNFLSDTPLSAHTTTLIKADLLIPEVSATSILAKVARDTYMKNLAAKYPHYHFEKHVGYGTAIHKKALQEFGPCPEHRHSFRPVADQLSRKPEAPKNLPVKPLRVSTTKSIGNQAEQKVADYLLSQNHTIIARNWRKQICEIDIVSTKQNSIYFTEVKYRKTPNHGNGLEAITKTKQKQMQKAAQNFIKFHPQFANFTPILAAASVTNPDFTIENFLVLT